MAEDPTALGDCLHNSRYALDVVALHLGTALALVRPAAPTEDAAGCAHEATSSSPYACRHCGNALPRDFYEPKAVAGAEVAHE